MVKLSDKPELIPAAPDKPNGDGSEPITIELSDDDVAQARGGAPETAEAPIEHKPTAAAQPTEVPLRQSIDYLNSSDYQRHLQHNLARQQEQIRHEQRARQTADHDALVHQMEAEQANYGQAQGDLERAWQAGDYAGAADAQARLTRISSRLDRLEQNVETYGQPEPQQPVPQQRQQPQPQYQHPAAQQPVPGTKEYALATVNRMSGLVPEERQWLVDHHELLENPQEAQRQLGEVYAEAQQEGLARGTPAYLRFFDEKFGFAGDEEVAEQPKPQVPAPKKVRTQAPVSRGVVNASTGRTQDSNKVTLSEQQIQAAQYSGVDLNTYAREFKRLKDLKARGFYTDSQ